MSIIGILDGNRPTDTLGGQRRLTVQHDRHVCRRAATVERQHAVEAGPLGDQGRAEGARRRTGQHRGDRLMHDLVGGKHAAVALHDVEGHHPAVGERVEAVLHAADVAHHLRLHRGIHQSRDRPLVLAVLPQHI